MTSIALPTAAAEHSGRLGLFAGAHPVPLKSTRFRGELKDLVTHMNMELVFENREEQPIEAVYSFPIAEGAVFLGLTLQVNEQVYATRIMERGRAVDSYEESVTDGDAAILVEEVADNLYSMQVGNIPASSEVRIAYHYSLLHSWRDDRLRWRLPTVLAPRYGESGLEPHHEPEADIMIEHPFSFELNVDGALAQASWSSPSHALSPSMEEARLSLALSTESDWLDRDIVILFQRQANLEEVLSLRRDRDIDGQACALLSFCPPPASGYSAPPKTLKILIDCSGSMTGESIRQARCALREMLQLVRPQDKVMVWKFGSSIEKLHQQPVTIEEPGAFPYQRIAADLGGTEIFEALTQIAKTGAVVSEQASDIFLVTDGEAWLDERAYARLDKALGNQQRVFSVGVGRAVSTEILDSLAKDSRGAVELVTPNENMAQRITSHFKRLYAPLIRDVRIEWPQSPVYQEHIPALFSGDTAHIGARFPHMIEGEVRLSATTEDGPEQHWTAHFDGPSQQPGEASTSTLARTVAHRQMRLADENGQLELALKYQLMSGQTACFASVELAASQQGDGQPAIRKVPSMLAAGYMGMDNLYACLSADTAPMFSRRSLSSRAEYEKLGGVQDFDFDELEVCDDSDEPVFDDSAILLRIEKFYLRQRRLPENSDDLLDCGLNGLEIIQILGDAYSDDGIRRKILEFLHQAVKRGDSGLSKPFSRAVRLALKE